MPLIEREKKDRPVPLGVSVEEDILALVTSYCDFAKSSKRHVVEKCLTYVMEKDKEFQEYLRTAPKPIFPNKPEATTKPTSVVPRKHIEKDVEKLAAAKGD